VTLHPDDARARGGTVRIFNDRGASTAAERDTDMAGEPSSTTISSRSAPATRSETAARPINLDLGGAGGPAPGERVLDAVVVRATDQTTTPLNA
jgi:hypothetical protein